MQEMQFPSLGQEDPLEEEIAAHSSILAWKILWTEEPNRIQSMEYKESDMTEQLSMHGWGEDQFGSISKSWTLLRVGDPATIHLGDF